jgi:phytoene dehydrogenase-like protein
MVKDTRSDLSTGTRNFDVVVVGAGYSGLITGAICAGRGLRVALVDHLDQVGGRGGATNYNGYWLDCTQRDAKDQGDTFLLSTEFGRHGLKAAEMAGADIRFVGPPDPLMKVHRVPSDSPVVALSKGPEAMAAYMTDVVGVPADRLPRFQEILRNLADEDYEKHIELTFADWLPTLDDPALTQAFLRWGRTRFSIPSEISSVGRLIQALRNPTEHWLADDPEVGGMQGFMEPYARVIRANGGTIFLGQETYEILTEDRAVTGVVVRDRSSTIQVISAPQVVFAQPAWELLDLLDESLIPADVRSNVTKLKGYGGDVMLMCMGLSELPVIRSSGQQDEDYTFNRILKGDNCGYGGGWWIPSVASKRQAPEGKHLIEIAFGTSGPGSEGHEPFKSFAEAKEKIDFSFDYMSRYYGNLSDILEWKTYNLVTAPTICEVWKPVRRAPLTLDTVLGLYMVDCTTEVDGQEQDIAANAAIQAAELIVARAERARAT